MTRLPRPYIPIDVRLTVAERQLGHTWSIKGQSRTERLRLMLLKLFGDDPVHLDHDPALENRQIFWSGDEAEYWPDANDPAFLIYRKADNHRIKTFVRGDGAQYSDAALARKNKRIARNRNPKRRKAKIPARVNPWPKRSFRR